MTPNVRIESRSLLLRPLAFRDVPRIFELSREDCARRWLPSQVYRDEPHAAGAVKFLIEQFDLRATPKTNAFVFGIEEKATGALIGHVGLSPLFGSVEVGFGIATAEQRNGFAAESVARICAWAWEQFALPEILGVTDEENVASQRVLLRCGFTHRETKRMRLQGVDRPVFIFGIRNGAGA